MGEGGIYIFILTQSKTAMSGPPIFFFQSLSNSNKYFLLHKRIFFLLFNSILYSIPIPLNHIPTPPNGPVLAF